VLITDISGARTQQVVCIRQDCIGSRIVFGFQDLVAGQQDADRFLHPISPVFYLHSQPAITPDGGLAAPHSSPK